MQMLQRLGLEPRSCLALRFGLVTGHSKEASAFLGEDAGRMERSGAWKEEEGWGGVRAGMTPAHPWALGRAEVTVGSMWVSSPGCPSWNWGQFGANNPLLLNLSFLRWEMVKMTENIS